MRRASFLAILVPVTVLACSGGTAPVSVILPGPNDSPGAGSDSPPTPTPNPSSGSGVGVGSGSGSGSGSGGDGGGSTGTNTGSGAGEPTCVSCAQKAFTETELPACEGTSSQLYEGVYACGCETECAEVCGDNLCSETTAGQDCIGCLAQVCSDLVSACGQDTGSGS